ncbi:zinc metalloproteinase nas-39-like [Penaeus japonicus]|uniref:zinc metalloproteinase nas-39-like n=1 Tax=Penaeus japonicus TaxID=27405 RepID=UPI001C70CF63|nr:zinc metalloproteinase nas-39-like [Penaeus japonicus]
MGMFRRISNLFVMTTLCLALEKIKADEDRISISQCHTRGGMCVLPEDCASSPSTPCNLNGTVCCSLPQDSSWLRDFNVSFRKRSCFNRKCLLWYNGVWLDSPDSCRPKRRLVSYCSTSRQWCCSRPCSEKRICHDHGGFCVTRADHCQGRKEHRWCKGKMCFCCIPDAMPPPCPCSERNASVCDGPGPILLSANDCLSVHSPNYPLSYTHNSQCSLDIIAPPECQIAVNFCQVSLERCPYDTLSVTGTNSSGPLCGTGAHETALSLSNAVAVTFTSDGTQSERGFRLALTALCEPTTTTTTSTTTSTSTSTTTTKEPDCDSFQTYTMCSTTSIVASTGVVVSPGYPNYYPNDRHCSLNITVPEGLVLALEYLAFNLEPHDDCKWDLFRVHDTNQSPDLQPAYCGSTVPAFNVSSTNAVRMEFKSDSTVIFTGFAICFRAIEK